VMRPSSRRAPRSPRQHDARSRPSRNWPRCTDNRPVRWPMPSRAEVLGTSRRGRRVRFAEARRVAQRRGAGRTGASEARLSSKTGAALRGRAAASKKVLVITVRKTAFSCASGKSHVA
jgi:hypothetical protein